ncbi:unnamed protein product [Sordaria macrospora k-hell]|uniref:WGS project CABT00000000 data, contig 2.40 n=1 Tax=Sordaria macrospora (strain ATCC MYA-333 / DSM 997 / K(L3346) / K-hell) TaxID=771870 RepID=F7W7M5_SORMK|nr:uncharacterized protein SMAC_07141 [Sordaria macrospora k-hell]CCC13517.1 unnamed protein product [Sordaria macrospora k-hell]
MERVGSPVCLLPLPPIHWSYPFTTAALPSLPPAHNTYPAYLPPRDNNNNNNGNSNLESGITMDAPSTPLDARIRRACIIEVIKEVEKYAHLDESLIRRMIEDVFTLQVHEELWKNEYGSVCPNVRNWAIDLRLVNHQASQFVHNFPRPAPSANVSPEYAAFLRTKIRECDGAFFVPDEATWRELRPKASQSHPGVYGFFHIVLSRDHAPAGKAWNKLEAQGQDEYLVNHGLVRIRIWRDVSQNAVVYQLMCSTKNPSASGLVKPVLGQVWLNLVMWACDVLLLSHEPAMQLGYPAWLKDHAVKGGITNLSPDKEAVLVDISEYARMVATFKAALPQAERLLADMSLDDDNCQLAMTRCQALAPGILSRYSQLIFWAAFHRIRPLDPYLLDQYPRQGLAMTTKALKELIPNFCVWKGRQYAEHWIEQNPLSLPPTMLHETAQEVLTDMAV